jgi:hypothetical protein
LGKAYLMLSASITATFVKMWYKDYPVGRLKKKVAPSLGFPSAHTRPP